MWIRYHHFILISYSRRAADRHHLSSSSFTWRTADSWTLPYRKHEFNARSCHSMSSGVHFYNALIRARGIVDVVPHAESETINKYELNIWICVKWIRWIVCVATAGRLTSANGWRDKIYFDGWKWERSALVLIARRLKIYGFFPAEMAFAVLPNCNYRSDGFRLITWRHTSMFSRQHNHKRNMITSKLYEKVIGHRDRTRVSMVRPIILLFEFSLKESSVISLHGLLNPPFTVQLRYNELSFDSKQ